MIKYNVILFSLYSSMLLSMENQQPQRPVRKYTDPVTILEFMQARVQFQQNDYQQQNINTPKIHTYTSLPLSQKQAHAQTPPPQKYQLPKAVKLDLNHACPLPKFATKIPQLPKLATKIPQ